jgi:hypothetical protein
MLFGREHAVTAVRDALADARDGRGRLLLVAGEAGIGKTALAGQLLREAPAEGVLVAWATCRPDVGAPAYWPWVQILRGLGGRPFTPAADPAADTARFRLFDELATQLADAGATQPVAVVLDDLHWCDEPSLLALAFVAERIRTARVLVLGTYREAEAGRRLLDLTRPAQVVQLGGLDEPDVARLMAAAAGVAPEPELVHDVWRRTGGNPFFAREVTRLMVARGGLRGRAGDEVPASVREVLRQRLSRLSPGCVDLLGTAAVVGIESTMDLLHRVTGLDAGDATPLVEEAVRAGVAVRPPAPAGRVRFVHELFRATVYESLEPGDRAGRHRAVADTLDRLRAAGRDVPAAELAAHYLRAGPEGAAEAVRYCTLAGAEAASRLAYEDACAHFERALDAHDGADGLHLKLLLDLGAARHRAGRADGARHSYRAASRAARALPDGAALATAALGLQHLGARAGTLDAEVDALLAEAVRALDEAHPLLPLVLAARARTLHHGHLGAEPADVVDLADRAVRLAHGSGDPATVATCLLALHDAHWRPGSAKHRLSIVEDMADAARGVGDTERQAQATQLRAAALIELGDPRGLAELAAYCEQADELNHPHARWNAVTRRATLALVTGDADAACAHIVEGAALGMRIGEPDALGLASTQAFALTLLGQPAPDLDRPATTYGRRHDPALAALAAHGRGDQRTAATLMAGYRLADSPRSHDPEPLVFAAFMLTEYGTDEERRQAYRALLPLAGTHSVVGGCASYQGAVDHHLATLAAALGRHDQARVHFAAAAAMYERLGAPGWAERARGQAGRPAALFRRDGDVWTLGFAELVVRVPDAKGLHDLAALLAAPGQPVHVRQLLGLPARLPGADPVLDARARAEYQARLADLDETIADADADHDPERAVRARAERDFLIAELAAATGLRQRPRRLGDETEKARKTVTARIRYAIERIRQTHPALAAHLSAHVHTGVECSYRPDSDIAWRL